MHEEITNKLISLLEKNSFLKDLLIKSIDSAKKINPDIKTNPVQNIDDYYLFIDRSIKCLPWDILPLNEHLDLYDRIDQSLDYFYFLNDIPLDIISNPLNYGDSIQYIDDYALWLQEFINNYGLFLSTKESWKENYYQNAYNSKKFGLQEDIYEDKNQWHSFNDFFSRKLKNKEVRPIDSINDDSIVVSPCDGAIQGIWHIDDNNKIDNVNIKSGIFDNIAVLLKDSNYSQSFKGGTFTHSFLDVHNYHRYHFPVSGKILEISKIKGDVAAGGKVKWDENKKKYYLNSINPGWQNIEVRALIIIKTKNYGLVALLPVGMSQVSSVNIEENLKVGDIINKGDPLGYFLFGGSDFIMIFQKEFEFNLLKLGNIKMGEAYGKLTQK